MVESGQSSIRSVSFGGRRHAGLAVEVVDRRELIARLGPVHFSRAERPSYHAFVLMGAGEGVHTLDFLDIPARPGRLLEIRPGQVQLWDTAGDFEASIVLAEPAMAPKATWFPDHASHGAYRDLNSDATATAEMLIGAMRQQQDHFNGEEATARLLGALFAALVALFDQAQPVARATLPEAYLAFRAAIENDLAASRGEGHRFHHSVTHYGQQLGYSARTLTRACQRVTGQSAKRVLAERLTLEAKRLLVHTERPAAAISTELGFSEPTNFSKFFNRHTGHSPGEFRRLQAQRFHTPEAATLRQ